jgi:hypothetical protein
MLMFPSALFLYISALLLLPCPSYYGQPFGISLSSHHSTKAQRRATKRFLAKKLDDFFGTNQEGG